MKLHGCIDQLKSQSIAGRQATQNKLLARRRRGGIGQPRYKVISEADGYRVRFGPIADSCTAT